MTMKVNLAEFMFGEKAGKLQKELEGETGVEWTIKKTCVNLADYFGNFKCGRCGVEYYGEWMNEYYFMYCPECGARILNEVDVVSE